MRKIELLCPASSLEVLKIAVIYGADAVYIGGEAFGLRAKAKNFSMEDMAEGIAFAHSHGVKVYVTANILAHNYDLDGVRQYFKELNEMMIKAQKESYGDWLCVIDSFNCMLGGNFSPKETMLVNFEGTELWLNEIFKRSCGGLRDAVKSTRIQ